MSQGQGDDWTGTPPRAREATATVGYGSRPPRGFGSTAIGPRPPAPPPAAPARGPRRARLQVRRLEPWSVLKFSLVFSVVLAIMFVVAVAVLYLLLSGMGVFDTINQTVSSFTSANAESRAPLFTARRVIAVAAVVGVVNVVLFTALATLGAFAYNLCADLVGGVEVTLAGQD